MRLRAKVDANQREIVQTLRKCGVSVQSLAQLGKGVPDLLIYSPRSGYMLLEIKDGRRKPSERRLTEDEQRWIQNWRGPVHKIETVDQALKTVLGW